MQLDMEIKPTFVNLFPNYITSPGMLTHHIYQIEVQCAIASCQLLYFLTYELFSSLNFGPVTDRWTESDAYESTVHKHRCAQKLKIKKKEKKKKQNREKQECPKTVLKCQKHQKGYKCSNLFCLSFVLHLKFHKEDAAPRAWPTRTSFLFCTEMIPLHSLGRGKLSNCLTAVGYNE